MSSANSSARYRKSADLFARASQRLVGGVNSPVRAFKAVGGNPVFVARAQGARLWDVDGNEYIDLVGSWGPAIVGHAHPTVVEAVQKAATDGLSFGACCAAEAELADAVCGALPSIEMVRFVNSGTEACMSAIRLARAATSRSKIIKFVGCYHGHTDALLVSAGSGAATFGTPNSAGVPASFVQNTLLAPYNDLAAVQKIMAEHGKDVAGIFVEPVAGNMGYVPPVDGFLAGLRELCTQHGALLVFDEVMTGFRVGWGGYQNLVGIHPDLTTLGKVIGGGMPVAAYGGPRKIMELVSPLGPMYQAGTLSGNPLGMVAGLATLNLCRQPGFYQRLGEMTLRLVDGLKSAAERADVAIQAGGLGGMLGFFFSNKPVHNFADAQQADHARFARFFQAMLDRGVWLPPSGYEAMFTSSAHTTADVDRIAQAAFESFRSSAS